MRFAFAILSALSGSVVAQDVVTAYLAGYGEASSAGFFNSSFTLVASIKAYSSSTTVMNIDCSADTSEDDCIVLGPGYDYTIISDNTYIGAVTTTISDESAKRSTIAYGFSCVHNTAASSVECEEEAAIDGQTLTDNMVYGESAGDFITVSIVGGKEKLQTTDVSPSASATPASNGAMSTGVPATASVASSSDATTTATGTGATSTGDATRVAIGGSAMIAAAGAALLAAW